MKLDARLLCGLLVAGCVQSASVVCGDGRVCPQGTTCVDDLGLCAREDQLAVCQTGALAGGDPCGSGGVCVGAPTGEACVNCVCVTARCGDGIVTAPEQCDGDALGAAPRCDQHGFYESTDVTCNASCEYDLAASCSRTCGDGVVEIEHGEQCDDTIAPVEPCVSFGFDAGFASCLAGGCSADLASCRRIGWTPVVRDSTTLVAASTTGAHVYIAGIGTGPELIVWHFDGLAWTRIATGVATNANAIYAASPTDIYVTGTVSTQGHLVHFDGTTWNVENLPSTATQYVAGSSSSDVYVFSTAGAMRHWDGTSWTTGTIANALAPRRAVAFAPNDIWLLTSSNRLFHYDGTWLQVTSPLVTAYSLAGVAGALYIVGDNGVYRRDGTTWTALPGAGLIERMYGTAADDLYAYGAGPGLVHWNGTYWMTLSTSPFGVTALDGSGPANVVLVESAGTISRYSGNAWQDTTIASTFPMVSVTGGANDDVFIVENSTAVHRVAAGVRTKLTLANVTHVGRAGSDVWATGSGGLMARWNGTTAFVSETATGDTYTSVAGPSTSVVFATTQTGDIIKRGASSWTTDSPGTRTLNDMWCGATECVAVGAAIAKVWKGTTWAAFPFTLNLYAVWGRAADDVWAVGDAGTVEHFDGTTWTSSRIVGEAAALVSISGTSSHDIVTTNQRGQLYHYDGAHWAPVRMMGAGQTENVWLTPQALWTVGDDTYGPGGTARTLVLARTYPWQ